MKDQPDSPQPARRVLRLLLVWIALFVLIAVIMTVIGLTTNVPGNPNPPYPLVVLIVGGLGATFSMGLLLFVRWLRCWRNLRRFVVGLAAFATLIAFCYTVENVRGKRAWERCKREFEAKGQSFDWSRRIPPPVPDDQNVFKAPRMNEWFVGRGSTELSKRLAAFDNARTNNPPLVLAELTVVPRRRSLSPREAEATLDLEDSGGRERALELIRDTVGPSVIGVGSYELTFVVRPLDQIKPRQLWLRADKIPTVSQLAEFFPTNGLVPAGWRRWGASRLRVESRGNNSFRVLATPAPLSAADFVAWSDRFEPDLDLIRDAVKRPYLRMDGDYEQPITLPIPNFITVRQTAQLLATRVKCCLLVGESDKALRELTLVHDLRRLLEPAPAKRPETLVAAMIDVSVRGLYVDTVAEGMRRHAWNESQLSAIQQQLQQVNLLPLVADSLGDESMFVARTLEKTPPATLANQQLKQRGAPVNWRERMKDPVYRFLTFAPRGWVYQNMVTYVQASQPIIESFDVEGNQVLPGKIKVAAQEIERLANSRWLPYSFLASWAVPNFMQATKTVALDQTQVNEALLACALERYHLARGEYPETIDALSPQFIEKIPHDLIGGQPLKYHRLAADKFLLYSVGWNETDDGGLAPSSGPTYANFDQGDWVW